MSTGLTPQHCERADLQNLIHRIESSSEETVGLYRTEFSSLLHHSESKLNRRWYDLLFGKGPADAIPASDKTMALLLGPEFDTVRRSYYNKDEDFVIDESDFDIDLSNVGPEWSMSQLNILAQNRGVKVKHVTDDDCVEIPAIVNLAIALSIWACRMGFGLFLWQRKKVTNRAGYSHWQRVPGLILRRYKWKPDNKFLQATYRQKHDFLCANSRLKSTDIVLPFLVDFPGTELEDPYDARVTADVDGSQPPAAAISIPGAGYIGWLDEFLPSATRLAACARDETQSGSGIRREVVVPADQRDRIRVVSMKAMYHKAMAMLDDPADDNSLMVYSDITDLCDMARKIDAAMLGSQPDLGP